MFIYLYGGFGCLNVCMGEKATYGEWRDRRIGIRWKKGIFGGETLE